MADALAAREERRLRQGEAAAATVGVPVPKSHGRPKTRWRTRYQRLEEKYGATEAEARERKRWVGELVTVLREADLPVIRFTASSLEPAAALEGVARGSRLATLRTRLRAWRKVSAWLRAAYGVVYPRSVGEFLAYLQMREAEPCGPTVLSAIVAAMAWM